MAHFSGRHVLPFFFSSRRRHTRFDCDWSSDVCSSDLYRGIVQCDGYAAYKTLANGPAGEAITLAFCWSHLRRRFYDVAENGPAPIASEEIGRASCRERV